jgi:RHS repeat-associated protein
VEYEIHYKKTDVPTGVRDTAASSAAKIVQPTPAATASLSIQEGGKLGNGQHCPANHRVCTRGCTISMVSGEALLEQIDFELLGPLPLLWNRTYRTSHNQDFGLGAGWSAPYFSRLLVKDKEIIYTDREGREIPFSRPSEGDGCRNTVERLTLYCDNTSQLRIVSEDNTAMLFKGAGKTKRLHTIHNDGGHNDRGHGINLQYSESGRLSHVIDSAGRRLKLEYNITNRLRSVNVLDEKNKPFGKPLVQYRYSNQGDLICVVDAAGNAQYFEYQNHVMTKRTTKDGFNYYFNWDQYDIHGKCVHNWGDRDMYDYRVEYDEANKVTKSTNSRGNTTTFHYNHLGLITKHIDPEGGVKEFEYDGNGHLLLERDPMGNTSRHSYNANGMLIRSVNPLGHTTRLTYDDAGRLSSVIDAKGLRWRRSYDAKGRLASASDPQGQAVLYRYDEHGNPTLITDAMRRNQRLEWNDKGELLAKTDAAGHRQEYRYDPLGRIIEVQDHSNQVTQYCYDSMGRVTQVLYPNGASVQLNYTPEGRLASYVNALGRTIQYRYDGLSQPVERINPHGQSFKYEYDAQRNLTALTNENGERYELHYDNNERLTKEVGFDGRAQHYGYDGAGHLVSHSDGNSRITQFKRDALGQLLKKWSSDQDISRYEYDPLGRLVYANNKDAELEFKYSDNGQLIEERQNGTRLRHEYDLNNQRSATGFNNERIEYEYNGQGLFKRIAYNGRTLTSVTRNAQGQEIARTSGAVSSFFQYDPMGRLVRQRATKDQNPILERNYQYDKSGNMRQIDDLKLGKILFKYDALDRLQAVEGLTPERFSFDPAGNLLDAREAFAGAFVKGNRLKVFQDYRFEYDDVGNLTGEKKGKKETRYYYNTQNQLIKAEKGGQVFQYAYDPLGRRIKKYDAFSETTYLWDGDTLLGEHRKNLKITYIYEPGSFKPLCQIRDGSVYYYHNDHTGTPLTVTDVNGDVVWAARYRAYGNVITLESEAIDNNIRFQGKYFDPETGLHYHRNRYYHPVIGRYIHQNPLGLLAGNNHYEYVLNPLMSLDPLGLSEKIADCPNIYRYTPLPDRQTAFSCVYDPACGKLLLSVGEPLHKS